MMTTGQLVILGSYSKNSGFSGARDSYEKIYKSFVIIILVI